jgi:hypothetical protein
MPPGGSRFSDGERLTALAFGRNADLSLSLLTPNSKDTTTTDNGGNLVLDGVLTGELNVMAGTS